ncbi:DUF4255 domain-containing protein [Paraburkholderia fungorum]|uniref:DUF4255 domain-containing protein n=1 Tax=Paraburkholderia fungorum TaxID=134537 RepID=UPI0038BC9196
MSTALGIAAVTAAFKSCLHNLYTASGLGTVDVTATAPDIVQSTINAADDGHSRVNLFLHQVTPNAAWRNVGLPSLASDGVTRLTSPPLALDLHYLLTVYASADCLAEALLGYAVQFIHETPVLPRAQIRAALENSTQIAGKLAASGLADQIEMLRITPSTLGREEMAWLWTALKADYRPTFPLQISVVLIERQLPTQSALPVLTRGVTAVPALAMQIFTVLATSGQAGAAPGDEVTIAGQSLGATSFVKLSNARINIDFAPFAPTAVADDHVTFKVPDLPADLPAGAYELSLLVKDSTTQLITQSSRNVPFALAPKILDAPAPIVAANGANTTVTIACKPQIRSNQSAMLLLNGNAVPRQAPDPANADPTATPSFKFPRLPAARYLARLRVDGVESPVSIVLQGGNPVFDGPWVQV